MNNEMICHHRQTFDVVETVKKVVKVQAKCCGCWVESSYSFPKGYKPTKEEIASEYEECSKKVKRMMPVTVANGEESSSGAPI